MTTAAAFCSIIPPHILDQATRSDDDAVAGPARWTLEHDAHRRSLRAEAAAPARPAASGAASDDPERTIYDAEHKQVEPGTKVRSEGQAPVSDASVNRAYDALGDTFEFYLKVYGRHSIDGNGMPLDATVHYGNKYDNAFWDGTRMIFGDGDGTMFLDFTIPVDVIGHELTHGVTQSTANLDYQGQSGALNESVSDVFGSLIKQYTLGQTADRADWLIGSGLLAPGVHGVALRSMKAPGTAYDDPRMGKDPQPGTMDGYVTTSDDNGGVHINSGIPNHAFYLLATALGGKAWEKAGKIWYTTLTGGSLASGADFAGFARLTATTAQSLFGAGTEHQAVVDAWHQVGIDAS